MIKIDGGGGRRDAEGRQRRQNEQLPRQHDVCVLESQCQGLSCIRFPWQQEYQESTNSQFQFRTIFSQD